MLTRIKTSDSSWANCKPYLVAGVESADGVSGEVAGAEGVAASRHVLADEGPRLDDLEVGLEQTWAFVITPQYFLRN